LYETLILTLLAVPAYYFGISGENGIDFMPMIDPLNDSMDPRY